MRDIVTKKYLMRFGGICAGLVIFFGVQLTLLKQQISLDVHITKEMDDRLRSMLVLDEFRLTDQRLTRYARAYCETKDENHWKIYDYVYDWSVGKAARPLQLDPELSFGVKGATISQMEILRRSDVPDHLLAYFQEALNYSDSLAAFETQAMETIRDDKMADGPSKPIDGETPTEFASRILYDSAYQDRVDKLASCLEDFSRLYNKMKNHDISEHRKELVTIYWWTLATQVITVLLLGLFLGHFFTTFRREEGGIRRELADSSVRLNQVTYSMALMENELKMAGQIQQEFLPPPFELQTNPVIWGKMIPAKATGGDFYDYHWIDPNRLGFSIGDVSGKGMSAAMFMARTLTLFRAGIAAMGEESGYDIAYLVTWINRQLVERNDHSMFVTFFVGILDKAHGLFRYCNAGHHFAIVIRKDGRLDIIETTPDLLMGIDAGYRYQEYSVPVEIGDTIILYTDGVVEAFSDTGDLYGEKRLHDFLKTQSISTKEAGAIVDILIGHVQQFAGSTRQSDDITVLVTKYQ